MMHTDTQGTHKCALLSGQHQHGKNQRGGDEHFDEEALSDVGTETEIAADTQFSRGKGVQDGTAAQREECQFSCSKQRMCFMRG